MDYESEKASSNGGTIISGRYAITSNTKTFSIPYDMKNIDEYTTTVDLLEGDTNENSSDMKYHIQMFDIDDMNSPSALVVLRTEDDGANQVVINKSATIGFSAGGHLAAMSGILWKEDIIKEYINTNLMNAKPNGVILCYPVVSGRICSERINAFDYLLGRKT